MILSAWCLFLGLTQAASWSFTNGKAAVGDHSIKFTPSSPATAPLTLSPNERLKLSVSTQGDGRPHQAFLTLRHPSGLETAYGLSVRESSARIDLKYNEIPAQFVGAQLSASVVLGGFGAVGGYDGHVFDVEVSRPVGASAPGDVLRYGKREEIHHIFGADPTSPPRVITLVFLASVLATLPVLLGVWTYLGANVKDLSTALSTAPLAHVTFVGSLFALEGIFAAYYTHWTLFQTLPYAGGVGVLAFLSGSRALTEVQARRRV